MHLVKQLTKSKPKINEMEKALLSIPNKKKSAYWQEVRLFTKINLNTSFVFRDAKRNTKGLADIIECLFQIAIPEAT